MRGRRFVSVGSKLASATLLVLAVVTGGVFLEVSGSRRAQLLVSKELALTMVARLFSAGAAAPLTFGDDRGSEEQVSLLTANDQVVYGAVWSLDSDEPPHISAKVGEFRRPGFGSSPPPSFHHDLRVVPGPDWTLAEAPVIDPTGKPVGMVQVALSLAAENAAIEATKRSTLAASIATALGVAVVLLLLSRTLIVRPMARLAAAAKRLQDGHAVRIGIYSNDEVGRVAQAFDAMTSAIASREERISARNRDLRRVLDNVAEGFLTVDKTGAMSDERSRVLDEWFGPPRKPGQFFDYVEQMNAEAAPLVELGWEELREGLVPWALTFHQMPHQFERYGRSFTIDYRPIGSEEERELVLVVIRDVTREIERERAAQTQKEMVAIVRRLMIDRSGLDDFFREANALVASIDSDSSDRGKLRRDLHTLKGNTALFGIESVAKFCHSLEQKMLDEPEAPRAADRERLRAKWATATAVYELLGGAAAEEGIEIDGEDYRALVQAVKRGVHHELLLAMIDGWKYERAATCLVRAREQLLSLAQRLGKGDLQVTIDVSPSGLRLPTHDWGLFWSAFAHVLRNVIDHGLEGPEERSASGKSLPAQVRLAIRATPDGVEISIADDGRGIDWEKIRTRAASLGLPHRTRADLEEALYADGVSSMEVVSEISGRGVGMGALRQTVRACGGRIELHTQRGKGTTFCFLFPAHMVPRAVSLPPLASQSPPRAELARPSNAPRAS